MHEVAHISELEPLIVGKTVALVGPAPELLSSKHGRAIDGHDVVVRANAAVPGVLLREQLLDPRVCIGERTTILAAATWAMLLRARGAGCVPLALWWMKLTPKGKRELNQVRGLARGATLAPGLPKQLWVYPLDMELRVRERVGADPTTGIRVIDALEHYLRPSRLSVYGMNFGGLLEGGACTSWYKPDRLPTPNHRPDLELETFKRSSFRFRRTAPGVWQST